MLHHDFQSVQFAAQERHKRGQYETLSQAVMMVIADCLMRNDDPGHEPSGPFFDWNWYRHDAWKAAKGLGVGVPVREILERRRNRKLAKAA